MPARWPKKKSLLMLTAVLDNIEYYTQHSVQETMKVIPRCDWHKRWGTYIDLARSTMAKFAIERNPDYVMFIDNDVVFKPEQVALLREHFDEDRMGAITGSYCYRDGSNRTTMGWLQDGEKGDSLNMVSHEEATRRALKYSEEGAVVPVDYLPGGFLLTTPKVLRKLSAPVFASQWIVGKNDEGQGTAHFVGEDVYFCANLKKAGYEPCCDFGVQIGHIGSIIYGLQGAMLMRRDNNPVK